MGRAGRIGIEEVLHHRLCRAVPLRRSPGFRIVCRVGVTGYRAEGAAPSVPRGRVAAGGYPPVKAVSPHQRMLEKGAVDFAPEDGFAAKNEDLRITCQRGEME